MTPTTSDPSGIDARELERRLQAVVPAVRIVRERHLRSILHYLADDGDSVTLNPDSPVWVAADRLRAMEILPADQTSGPGNEFLLLSDPADRLTAELPPGVVLRLYRRLLFQAVVWGELARRIRTGELSRQTVDERFAALGQPALRELRYVLESDHVVVWGADPTVLYPAFAAVFLDLFHFDRDSIPWVFPSLDRPAEVAAVLAADVDAGRLLATTEVLARPGDGDGSLVPPPTAPAARPRRWVAADVDRFAAEAERADRRGNHVRAALLLERIAVAADASERDRLQAGARLTLRRGLVERLGEILDWDSAERARWGLALEPLLAPAARGIWPRAARALYDLQRIVTDLGGELSVVDPFDWALSLGRRPLRRPLTRARPVVLLGHLRSARRHLARTPLAGSEKESVARLLDAQIHRVEGQIRTHFGPMLRQVFEEVGFCPASVPEAVARDKLIEELEDRLCERGFLRFGDLRDAVARNQLKLGDLEDPFEWLRGDALLRVDVRLAEELDGVYRRGEFYLRGIQRVTATSFGTPAGRWLSKYVVFPFGGAFLIVEFAKYLGHEVRSIHAFVRRQLAEPTDPAIIAPVNLSLDGMLGIEEPAAGAHAAEAHGVAATPESIGATLLLGVMILLLLHSPPFRSLVLRILGRLWRAIVFLTVDLPRAVWHFPPVRAVRRSRIVRLLARRIGPALLITSLVAVLLLVAGSGVQRILRGAGVAFAVGLLVASTPYGRRAWDDLVEGVSDTWRVIRVNLIPGLVSWLVWAFRALAGMVERSLYAIDEWFRFREGQSGRSLGLKAALAVFWYPVEYLFRFAFYLLLEPQVNPIKHFPVVTVSHKLLFPLIGVVSDATGLSVGVVTILIWCIPGVFGFIAWELKENWRLYAANRQAGLPRVVLGHHGETMRGLLRPGFHSGTVPGLFRKLRRALQRSARAGQPARLDGFIRGLDEVRHALENFVERELIALLRTSRAWQEVELRPSPVRVGVQSVEVGLDASGLGPDPLRVTFEHVSGEILAHVAEPDWRVSDEQRATLRTAVAGFCEMAASRAPHQPRPIRWEEWVAAWDRKKTLAK